MWFFVFNWLFFGKWNLKKESKRFFLSESGCPGFEDVQDCNL
jgi:hypothetical protein